MNNLLLLASMTLWSFGQSENKLQTIQKVLTCTTVHWQYEFDNWLGFESSSQMRVEYIFEESTLKRVDKQGTLLGSHNWKLIEEGSKIYLEIENHPREIPVIGQEFGETTRFLVLMKKEGNAVKLILRSKSSKKDFMTLDHVFNSPSSNCI